MKRFAILSCTLVTLTCGVAFGQTTLPDVEPSLKAYYDDAKNVPPWKDAVTQLSASEPARRQTADNYLRALLSQSLKDEESGAAPWRATPYWGQSAENPARVLREEIINGLSNANLSEQAVPVLRWYIDEQKNQKFAATACMALAKVSGPDADVLLAELALRPHANSEVTTVALQEAWKRKLAVQPQQVMALCQHHRAGIREAARALARQLGADPIPPYSDAVAMKSASIREVMDALSGLIIEPPSADAPFGAVTETDFNDGKQTEQTIIRGWVTENKDGKVTLLTPFGKRKTFEIAEKPKQIEKGSWSFTCTCAPIAIDQEVARVANLRQKGDPDFELSERGGLTGQFQGSAAGLYEAELAHWLYASNRIDLAAKVLLPALDTYYEDQGLVDMSRARLGLVSAYRMLACFVGDRDYQQTAKWATVLQEKFTNTPFSPLAKELARQLPLRHADFKTLTLPDARQWAELQNKMKRPQQIQYLAERLRLLNCFQHGQPGGVDLDDKQYAEPCGLSDDAAWSESKGKTELINALVELEKQKLTIDDIPLLSPYLKDDWFILAVEFWRDFSAERDLLRTRPIVADLINKLAGRDLCSDYELRQMNAGEAEKYIQKIDDYARENGGKPEADLLLATLKKGAADGSRWFDFRLKADRLVELQDKRAASVILEYLKGRDVNEYEVQEIMSDARKSDPAAVRAIAPAYLEDKRLGVRVEVAVALLGTDQASLAYKALGDVLAKGDYSNLSGSDFVTAVDALLKEKNDDANKAALRIFEGLRLGTINVYERTAIMKAFVAAGMPDGFRYYLKLMDQPGNGFGGIGFAEPVAQAFSHEVLNSYDGDDADLKKIAADTADKPEQATQAVRQWLNRKIAAMEARPVKR